MATNHLLKTSFRVSKYFVTFRTDPEWSQNIPTHDLKQGTGLNAWSVDRGSLILQLAGVAALDDSGHLVEKPRHEHTRAAETVGGVPASVTEELVSCLNHFLSERLRNE